LGFFAFSRQPPYWTVLPQRHVKKFFLRAMRASVISVRSVVKNMTFEVYVFFLLKCLYGVHKNVYHRVHRGHRGAHGAQENVLRVKLSGTKVGNEIFYRLFKNVQQFLCILYCVSFFIIVKIDIEIFLFPLFDSLCPSY